jgi:hypothetical protein
MSDQHDLTPQWGVNILIAIERLDAKISSNDERHTAAAVWSERNIKDHETRLRTLEQFRWILLGAALAGGGVGSIITRAIIGG